VWRPVQMGVWLVSSEVSTQRLRRGLSGVDQPYSEADTRRQIIDGGLRLAGWDVDDPSQVIQELDIYVGGGDPSTVRERLSEYAEHLQRIHGGVPPFILYTNGYDTYF
jgi:type I site-specific restriction endonuclease